jgi:hypothetical protein
VAVAPGGRPTPAPDLALTRASLTLSACAAHAGLALAGLYVEPTAAVCWAALRAGLATTPAGPVPGPRALAPLCGSGLKSKPPA